MPPRAEVRYQEVSDPPERGRMSKDPEAGHHSLSWGHSHSRLLKRNREAGVGRKRGWRRTGTVEDTVHVLGDKTR